MVVITSTVDPPQLTEAAQQTCMSMARKSALAGGSRGPTGEALDPVRVELLHEAAAETERYLQRMLFRGDGGPERVSVSEIEVSRGVRDIPVCPTLPDVSGVEVSITSVERWNDDAADYVQVVYTVRPGGRIRVEDSGTYRITASLTPDAVTPTWAITATGRLFSWRDRYRTGAEGADSLPMPASGGLLKSGAASVLRQHRRQWTT